MAGTVFTDEILALRCRACGQPGAALSGPYSSIIYCHCCRAVLARYTVGRGWTLPLPLTPATEEQAP